MPVIEQMQTPTSHVALEADSHGVEITVQMNEGSTARAILSPAAAKRLARQLMGAADRAMFEGCKIGAVDCDRHNQSVDIPDGSENHVTP